jgi:ubiquinone/menaquinone biosynthesis C-methylase UbiE
MSKVGFKEKSYKSHQEHYFSYAPGENKDSHAKTWLRSDTLDYWRHHRMYQCLDPLIETDLNATWLTVGDGRYGTDANYLKQKGIDALATDIGSKLLEEAQKIGFIEKFKEENAENLSFDDDSFDYVFCKESYHHFPRPMLALHEMLRVSKKAVILIEPNDAYVPETLREYFFVKLKNILKIILRKGSSSKH